MNLEIQKAKLEQADDLDLMVGALKVVLAEDLADGTKDLLTSFLAHYILKSERIRMKYSPAQRIAEIKEQLKSKEVENV